MLRLNHQYILRESMFFPVLGYTFFEHFFLLEQKLENIRKLKTYTHFMTIFFCTEVFKIRSSQKCKKRGFPQS